MITLARNAGHKARQAATIEIEPSMASNYHSKILTDCKIKRYMYFLRFIKMRRNDCGPLIPFRYKPFGDQGNRSRTHPSAGKNPACWRRSNIDPQDEPRYWLARTVIKSSATDGLSRKKLSQICPRGAMMRSQPRAWTQPARRCRASEVQRTTESPRCGFW